MQDDETLAGSAAEETSQPEGSEAAPNEAEGQPSEGEGSEQAKAEGKPETPSKDTSDDAEESKPKRSARERIDELTGKYRAEERAKQAALKRAERAEERLKGYETPPPKEFDFQTLEEYQAALTAHHARQLQKDERQHDIEDAKAEAERADQEGLQALREAFDARAQDFADRVPDYHEKAGDPNLPISTEMAKQLLLSDKGPEVTYYLATHRAEAARIASLGSELDVARAIGQIEGRLTTPAPKKVTTAPDPIKAVATGSGSQGEFDPGKASVDDMAAHLKKQSWWDNP